MLGNVDVRLAYVYAGKVLPEISSTLVGLNLAVELSAPLANGNNEWIGMHPKLADVYMTALASEIANRRRYALIADDAVNQIATAGFTFERLAELLLGNEGVRQNRTAGNSLEIEERMAALSVEAVIPEGIGHVPIEKIVEFRQKYNDERVEYQQQLRSLLEEHDWLVGIDNESALMGHLQNIYKNKIEPKKIALKKALKDIGVNTTASSITVGTLAPKAATLLSTLAVSAVNPIFGLGVLSLSLIPIVLKAQKAATDATKDAPAYLLYAEEELSPKSALDRLATSARRFALLK